MTRAPQAIANVHLGLGQRSEALRWLERAWDEQSIEVLGFSGPIFDLLQAGPRYRDLLRRMKLDDKPEYAAGQASPSAGQRKTPIFSGN